MLRAQGEHKLGRRCEGLPAAGGPRDGSEGAEAREQQHRADTEGLHCISPLFGELTARRTYPSVGENSRGSNKFPALSYYFLSIERRAR